VPASEYLPFEVERLLTRLLQKELNLAKEGERMKQELAASYDYSLDRLFSDVDDINYKYIDASTLKRFLIKVGIAPTDKLLIGILRRFDVDADAKLNQKEFKQGLTP
jgi:Ca2+-binding EF-hand superfamily protein